MKKFTSIMLLVFMTFALLTGCSLGGGTADETPADPTLHCTIYEDQKPEFTFTHVYGNEGQQQTWFWADCDMTGAAIICINYDEETFEPSAGDVLYSFGDVAAGEGILLYTEMPEGYPLYAITYTAAGETYTYAMGYSGLDGSTTLTELGEM